MKNRVIFFSILMTLFLAGCSNLVRDLGNLKGGVKYTVNHLLQNLDAATDDDYTLEKSEELYGLPGALTEAKIKTFKGFSLAKNFEITQVEIAEDESTVVEIKYDRNEYTFQFNPDGGLWNYDEAKADPSVPKLADTVKVTGRYGAVIKENVNYPDFDKLKKKGCLFLGWMKEGDDKLLSTEELEASLPETFDEQEADVVYIAQWEISGTKYTVRHMTENLDGITYESIDKEMGGDEGDLTEAVPIQIEGFIKPDEASVVQKEIVADGSTVVEIKYARASYDVVIDLNGGYWNYYSNKANPSITLNGANRTISVKYEASLNLADYIPAETGKKSMKIAGWFMNGDTTVVIPTEDAVITSMPAKNVEYKASWVENKAKYTIEYWLENASDDKTSIDADKTEEYEGLAESETQIAVADLKDIEGFTKPLAVENKEIAADGSTVVKVEYKRIKSILTLKPNGGYWNYEASKASSGAVKPDANDKTVAVKFGGTISYPAEMAALGMKGNELAGWKLEGTETLVKDLPVVFEKTEDVTYIAVWTEKKAAYKVEYRLQNIEGTEYVADESLTETLAGPAETPTKVSLTAMDGYYIVRDIPGFSKPEKIDNKEIAPDGSTVIVVNYTRNTYEIKFELDDGMWNYSQYYADPSSVTADIKAKTLNVKYGADINYPSFADMNKRSYEFSGWITDEGNNVSIEELSLKQTVTKNVTYTAKWTKLVNIKYTVEHWFENEDSTNADLVQNYSVDSRYTDEKTGVAEMLTEAEALPVQGFTAKAIEQKEISRNGDTVVKVYYKRNIVNINFDLNGGYWDYNSAKTDNGVKFVSGKYGTSVSYASISFAGIGRKSYEFKGWTTAANATPVEVSGLTGNYPVEDLTYTAAWENIGNVKYTVKHWFEKTSSTNAANQNATNYEQSAEYPDEELFGEEDDTTDAQAKIVEGFEARSFTQTTIKRDGSAVVNIYYARKTGKITLKANGGTWSGGSTADKSFTGKYGTTLTSVIPEPSKSGYAFGGWNEYQGTVDTIFGEGEVIYTAYWVPSVTVEMSFSGDISMTLTTNAGTTTGTVTLPSGYSASDATYKWYIDGVFGSDEATFVKTKAQLGVGNHIITVKVTIDGVVYTKQASVSVSN